MKIIEEKEISTGDIVISPRPVWKCTGCREYGIRPSCAPNVPDWQDAVEWAKNYKTALLIKFGLEGSFHEDKRKILNWILDREKELFKNHTYVFALFPGHCTLCEDCACEKGNPCTQRYRVRPSLDAIGIELSRLVNIDYTENVLYSIIFLD
ncbi:MAG: DUF2284 domain-containing protein [Spirochaetes bacterium]|nr:DUF2284 domain-containing protein [Spirochaetota bacterium]